ncbi:hypothetical protein [Micrococcus endophyticus]|uniref:Uncharacterized protein n=1 Tax=Micrococcus endophyticus TaxID=455343 RepID=A0A7W9JKG7_9MICC|nr:hypothetical protein [Micrococcus endophyticus]MBB5849319.1 hypothetical protein [Micrococcus endophyticus]
MRLSAPPRRPRVTRMAALTAVVVLGVAGCTGPEGRTRTTTTGGPGTSTSPPPVVQQSEAAAHPADTLPLGDEAAVAALRELFDGTVQVTPPGGADVEMRLRRADVELVLSEEG